MFFKNLIESLRNLIFIAENFPKQKNIIFFSEGNNHWKYLEPFIFALITLIDNKKIKYITQSKDDLGYKILRDKIDVFYIGSGRIRDYILSNIDASVFFTSSPDIDQLQVKKSKSCKHYCYIQHSLNSLMMAYNEFAFKIYDSMFICGEHHKKEIEEIIRVYNWKKKKLYNSIYSPLINSIKIRKKNNSKIKSVLIAPTWGPESIIESGKIYHIIDQLISDNFVIYLRPHPETIKHCSKILKSILNRYKNNQIILDQNTADFKSLQECEILITDWSGIAFDFALGLKKPVIFFKTNPKIKNINFSKINIEPIEQKCKKFFGIEVSENDNLAKIIKDKSFITKMKPENVENIFTDSPIQTMKKFITDNKLLFK